MSKTETSQVPKEETKKEDNNNNDNDINALKKYVDDKMDSLVTGFNGTIISMNESLDSLKELLNNKKKEKTIDVDKKEETDNKENLNDLIADIMKLPGIISTISIIKKFKEDGKKINSNIIIQAIINVVENDEIITILDIINKNLATLFKEIGISKTDKIKINYKDFEKLQRIRTLFDDVSDTVNTLLNNVEKYIEKTYED